MDLNDDFILRSSKHYYLSTLQKARNLLYYPLSVGCFQCVPGYAVNRQSFDSFLLLVMLDGNLRYQTPASSGVASPGDVMLLNCHAPHMYAAKNHCSFLFVHFDGAQSEPLYQSIVKQHGNVLSLRHTGQIVEWMGALLEGAPSQLIDEAEVSIQIYTILVQLLSAGGCAGSFSSKNQAIDESILYILDHLSDKLTVEHIAAQAGYSASYFSRAFRQQTGCSPYRFILQCRIERAQQLLRTSRNSILDIALQLGFGTFANFSYTFRKETGYSPNEYRKLPM